MADHVDVLISGVKLKFPNKPYPSQICMMTKIIKGLQAQENCLLESPTGSGKTLSLLCAAIAWQNTERQNIANAVNSDLTSRIEKLRSSCYCDCNGEKKTTGEKKKVQIEYEPEEKEHAQASKGEPGKCECVCHGAYSDTIFEQEEQKKIKSRLPKIYYTTRTHKQIANVIREFKKTAYCKDTRMTILASRAHTCIHPQISKLPNKDDVCKKLNKEKHIEANEFQNVEKLDQGCAFFDRFKKQQLSYENYGFKQAVWDIEELIVSFKRKRLCPYYGSRELMTQVDVIFCPYNYLIDPRIRSSSNINLKDEIVIIDEAHNIEDSCRESATFIVTKADLELSAKELDLAVKYEPNGPQREAAIFFQTMCERMIQWIDRNSATMQQRDFDASIGRVWNGIEIVAEFKLQGIGPDKFTEFNLHMRKLFAEGENNEPGLILPDQVKILIESVHLILSFLYMEDHEFMHDYKIALTRSKVEEYNQDGEVSSYFSSQRQPAQAKWTFAINFWCLNPGVAFHYFKTCHSVILCSGTLTPMDTFQSELGVKFEHQLEANHVITDKQVWVGCLGYGPTDYNLLATFKSCETLMFQDEIGRLVLDVCRNIPFGVLFFLPSYTLLNKLLGRWEENGILKQIREFKRVFTESRVAKDFDQLLKDYYECIDNSVYGQRPNGALMLAVFRGRASEGLDFSDNYGRAVIALGIPYPNIKDVQVDLKRQYNNLYFSKKKLLKGDDWYEIQAYRAVNQALGRCIRHRNDWGAIILVDDRYFKQPQKYSKGLSKWIRNRFRTFRNYNEAMDSLRQFSETMKDFKKPVVDAPKVGEAKSILDDDVSIRDDFDKSHGSALLDEPSLAGEESFTASRSESQLGDERSRNFRSNSARNQRGAKRNGSKVDNWKSGSGKPASSDKNSLKISHFFSPTAPSNSKMSESASSPTGWLQKRAHASQTVNAAKQEAARFKKSDRNDGSTIRASAEEDELDFGEEEDERAPYFQRDDSCLLLDDDEDCENDFKALSAMSQRASSKTSTQMVDVVSRSSGQKRSRTDACEESRPKSSKARTGIVYLDDEDEEEEEKMKAAESKPGACRPHNPRTPGKTDQSSAADLKQFTFQKPKQWSKVTDMFESESENSNEAFQPPLQPPPVMITILDGGNDDGDCCETDFLSIKKSKNN